MPYRGVIKSLQNPQVKAAARLRVRRHRSDADSFLIDGAREIGRAFAAGVIPTQLFVCPRLSSEAARQLAERMSAAGAPIWEVAPSVFAKLAYGEREDGLIAIAQAPRRSLDDLPLGATPLVIVLEGLEKPGNLGAVLRTADAANATAVIAADCRTDLYNPNTIRASLGTVFSLPVVAASSQQTLEWLGSKGIRVFAARVDAQVPYTKCDFRQPAAIVLGSEAHGLSDVWQAPEVHPVRLPMHGVGDSLNVSVTAAVLLYEAVRQRDENRPG